VLLIGVGYRADRRHALAAHDADLARAEPQLGIALVAADQLDVGAGGARELAAAAGLELDVVHDRADRDGLERHGVARLHVGALARDHLVAGLETLRRQDVGEIAVVILDQRDERRAVGVVLEALDGRADVELAALEVDRAVALLVAAATLPGGDAAV